MLISPFPLNKYLKKILKKTAVFKVSLCTVVETQNLFFADFVIAADTDYVKVFLVSV